MCKGLGLGIRIIVSVMGCSRVIVMVRVSIIRASGQSWLRTNG